MPTYEYKCNSEGCKTRFEVVQKISEDPIVICPTCREPTLKKIITSTGGFQLKGSGWYKDGY